MLWSGLEVWLEAIGADFRKRFSSRESNTGMLVARVSALRTSENLLGSVVQPICIRRVSLLRSSCLRQYSQATSPIPPPLPSETTSQSSGLNHQLHPTGRPPLSPTSRSSSTSTAESIAQDESATTVSAETDSATASGVSSITGGYRTPLRVTNSNIPVSARDTVKVVYEAPLLKPVRGLKAFSISSLILSGALTPFILTLEAPIPPAARVSIVTAGTLHHSQSRFRYPFPVPFF